MILVPHPFSQLAMFTNIFFPFRFVDLFVPISYHVCSFLFTDFVPRFPTLTI